MDTHFWLEMIGYLGSVLVAISLMMRSLVRLRTINSAGCVVFVIYGILIHAYPVAILNGFIVGVNAFYLSRMFRQKDYFQLLEISHDSTYLSSFLDFYKEDVRESTPTTATMWRRGIRRGWCCGTWCRRGCSSWNERGRKPGCCWTT